MGDAPPWAAEAPREGFVPAGGYVMRSGGETCIIGVALTLALLAAVMSAPGQAGRTSETLQSVNTSDAPQADMVARPMVEIPENFLSP
jgi:hypothetical protein